MDNQKIINTSIYVVLFLAVSYFAYKFFTKDGTPLLTDETKNLDFNVTLSKGSSGEEVRYLQNWLKKRNALHLLNYGVDGAFGTETLQALVQETGRTSISLSELT